MAKIEFVRRLGTDWRDLADTLVARTDEQQRFSRASDPGRAIWDWLSDRERLTELPDALIAIGREDLADLLGGGGGEVARQAIDFSALINERTEDFVGRRRLARALWDTFDDPSFRSGYLILKGEPGIGKTALMASLVQHHGLVHHFNSAMTGLDSADRFLRNVCAQLIVTYRLPYRRLPNDVAADSATLLGLLGEAAGSGRVVVAVDAVDEAADRGSGGNRLLLPPALPPNTYLLVSLRDTEGVPLYVDERREVTIDERDPENLSDAREYIEAFVRRHQAIMVPRLAELALEEAELVDALTERSEGNFMYLRSVLRGVRDRTLGGAGLDSLPQGLQAYYAHLERQLGVGHDAEPGRQLRILAVLATWPEPLSVDRLAQFAGETSGTTAAVVRRWSGFLNRLDGDVPRFALYHASFRDFLADRLDLGAVRTQIALSIERTLP
ncbi:hypothetical protein AB0H36_11675 [Kribbella sp. NPDC050820]|uniref:hypothetical protein n=1 Tax=Kribbella sp. NPDC050820 TaxID=3155408 RepID=UPI003400C054